MKRCSLLVALGVLRLASLVILASPALADVPHIVNMQGILRDGSGDPVADGSYNVTFVVYDSAAGGNVMWTESHLLSTTDGLFSVLLGSVAPLPDSVFFDTSRYLGVTVPPDPEMTPRQRLSSTGYSFVSSQWTSAGPDLYRMSGTVGIGIPTPTVRLQAGSEGSEGTPAYISGTQIAAQATNPDNWAHMAIISGSFGRSRLNFGDAFNDDQGIVSYDNASDAMWFSTAASEKMRITSAGQVGIGTNAPQSPMVIQGASNWGVAEVVGSGTNVESSIGFRSSNLAKGALGTWVLGVNNNAGLPNAFSLYAANGLGAGSQAVTVLTSGFVGIGLPTPVVPLQVHDPSNTINGSRVQLTTAAGGSGLFDGTALIGVATRSFLWNYENGPLMIGTNNVERVRVDSVGNVGVGLTAPTVRVHTGSVGSEGTPAFIAGTHLAVQATNPDNWTHMAIISGSAGRSRLNFGDGFNDDQGIVTYDNSADAMWFSTAASEKVRITSTGRVGVGTNAPQGALDVVSTTGAFIVPRMTTADRDGLAAVNGMIIYNTSTNQFNFREAGAWVTK